MKERPILFNGEMVRAILEGHKTQTRRIVKPQPWSEGEMLYWTGNSFTYDITPGNPINGVCPFGKIGDRLWVRETWQCAVIKGEFKGIGYKASYSDDREWFKELHPPTGFRGALWYELWDKYQDKWRPSIHMPRWASRITLEITRVRVERLQEISNEDAQAEGTPDEPIVHYYCDEGDPNDPEDFGTHRCNWRFGYKLLWESINGKGSWDLNPWVFVIEFKKL